MDFICDMVDHNTIVAQIITSTTYCSRVKSIYAKQAAMPRIRSSYT